MTEHYYYIILVSTKDIDLRPNKTEIQVNINLYVDDILIIALLFTGLWMARYFHSEMLFGLSRKRFNPIGYWVKRIKLFHGQLCRSLRSYLTYSVSESPREMIFQWPFCYRDILAYVDNIKGNDHASKKYHRLHQHKNWSSWRICSMLWFIF